MPHTNCTYTHTALTHILSDGRTIRLRTAHAHDASAIYSLMTSVYAALENKDLFFCDSEEYVRAHVNNSHDNGFAVVAEDSSGCIVGSCIFRFPHMDEDNLGRDLNFSTDELEHVAHMESAVVHPKWRGHGLQQRIVEYGEDIIPAHYTIFLATVSPYNPASLKTFEKCGYEQVKHTRKYGGRERYIVRKNRGDRQGND